MTTTPPDRGDDPHRKIDFLSEMGMSPEEQAEITSRAGKPLQSFTWGRNTFNNVPCRDCSGSLREHDETCIHHPKHTAIRAVEDPSKGFENLHTDEDKK